MSTVVDDTLSIGEVGTRLGLPVSTLRWWEKCGLVAPTGRRSNRRRYTPADVRRIASIQLWQTHAGMSLDEIAVFLAGRTADDDWRTAVTRRLASCDDEIRRLQSARATLAHMLRCPDDHPAEKCPYLAEVVDGYLDTGRMPDPTTSGPRAKPATA